MTVETGVTYTRVTIREEVREFHRVDDVAEAVAWVRSLGHEARDPEEDGFRYRTVYGDAFGQWWFAEPGDWICHMTGTDADNELDCPTDTPYLGGPGWTPNTKGE